ncbi:MAG: NAD(P)/FAD-dependent oxidoreductase [Mizugakiibacter sp.]|uniref:NAD(P)/FAD-dependent oxidoreductase n=1 Tax=Mizugakiibacter sp. TaxID=1972610 RepID=UPI0031BE1146|nr:NAD(P)/FAD-dependent oxidoreductase [Xanthomonadaceae bacterium]
MEAAYDVEAIVVGAGVVGLACAHALAAAGREVWVLEAEPKAGEGISSRNSGVIHAGLYYPSGSLKARLCVRGNALLYAWCQAHAVPHRRLGKLVVAASAGEVDALRALQTRAQANGAQGLRWLDAEAAQALEPALRCAAALESPSSGIVDVPAYVISLLGAIEHAGGQVLVRTRVGRAVREADGFRVETADGGAARCRVLVNAAGLGAVELARRVEGLDARHVPALHYAAGHYYALHGRAPFARLIYPLPQQQGLGVHLGFDMAGRARFGPDVRWLAAPDYRFDDSRRTRFADAVRAWWPALRDEDLAPDFVGVRPKLAGPGEPMADFRIDDAAVHGVPGLVNLFGIESPGLTASLALGEEVRDRLAGAVG